MDVFEEQNRVRTNPKSYIEKLERATKFFKEKIFRHPAELPIETYEGVQGFYNAIEFLKNQEPIEPLEHVNELSQACKDHAKDLGSKGLSSHEGSDGNGLSERTLESVGYNYDSAISILSFHKITMPILLKARLSFVNLGFGVEPAYTVGALAKCRFRSSTEKVDLKALRPGVDRFTYCLMGTLSVAGTVGGFIKYYPSGACQIPEGGPKYNYWTIGISFGF